MSASLNHTSPLSSADAAFRLLTRGPAPLSLDGTLISAVLPQRLIPLDELKRILLRPAADAATRDAAWSALVTRARSKEPAWVIGAVGVAMPGLRRAAGQLARGYDAHTAADIDAEVLTGFLTAVRSLDLSRRAIALRLRWAAYRAGAAYRTTVVNQPTSTEDPALAVAPPLSWGHPDMLLADAITQGVISAADAALIGSTRLESQPLTAVAQQLAVPYDAARMRRSRAESRLVSAIRTGQVGGTVDNMR
jgi:hypothetical protein